MGQSNIQKELMNLSMFVKGECGTEVALYSSELPEATAQEGFVVVCHCGSARTIYNSVEYVLSSRDMIIIFPGDMFSFCAPSADVSLSWIRFSKQDMAEVLRDFPTSFFGLVARQPICNLADNQEYEQTMGLVKLMQAKSAEEGNIFRGNIMAALLRVLFMEVLNRVVHSFEIDISDPKHRRQILNEFIKMVTATPRCREVAYFAERLKITPKQLSAIVADGTGYGAKEFIERNTISEIKRLLRTTKLKVKQIAEQLGFSSDGNMCRFFKTNTGITVSDFKRSNTNT